MQEVLVAFHVGKFGGVPPDAFIWRERGLVLSFKFVSCHEEMRVIAMRPLVMAASQVHPM
jgi:hypothetical protein